MGLEPTTSSLGKSPISESNRLNRLCRDFPSLPSLAVSVFRPLDPANRGTNEVHSPLSFKLDLHSTIGDQKPRFPWRFTASREPSYERCVPSAQEQYIA